MKLTIETMRSFGLKNRKTYAALLRLAKDRGDAAALIVIFEENREPIEGAVRRWLGNERKYDEVAKDVLLRIGEEARHFDCKKEDATDFVCEWAQLECRRLRLELELSGSASN